MYDQPDDPPQSASPLQEGANRLRLALSSSLPAGILGLLLALLYLSRNTQVSLADQPVLIMFSALSLFQMVLGLLWKRWFNQGHHNNALSLSLTLSAVASGMLWGQALGHMLQLGSDHPLLLIAPLLAIFVYGLHFSLLGVHLLLFTITLLFSLLLTGAGNAEISPALQTLLIVSAVIILATINGMHLLIGRFVLLLQDRGLLQQEAMMLQDQSNKLQQEVKKFEDKSYNLKEELGEAIQVAESADMKKNEFLATMSHEIRTPLNGILPLLEMLSETGLNKEQKKLVNTAQNSSRHLLRIINDILDFSKIEAGKLELEQVEISIAELVEGVTSLMTNMAAKRHLTINQRIASQVPYRLRGDPLRLRQILSNLVSNAVKFTERGGVTIEVSAARNNRRDVEVMFAVRDTGVGMDSATMSRLFSSFTQADASTTRKYGGTGLGLAICKRLVNLMGGQIGVRSKIGKGSVFWFLIPMRRPLDEVPARRESLQGASILLVGFNSADYSEISHILSRLDVNFSQAEDVPKALSALGSAATLGESWQHDLMIFDANYLGKASRNLMTQLKKSSRIAHTPTLAIVNQASDAAELSALGVNETLTRPIREAMINQIMCRLLDVRDDEDYRESELLEKADNVMPMLERDILDQSGDSEDDSIPVESPSQARKATPPVSDPPAQPLTGSILLVEDNDVNRMVARRLLEKLGLKVSEASDGAVALNQLKEHSYDLVFMDCRMPNMDGYEATGEIRNKQKSGELGALPVIAMTANAMAGDREKCLDAGMDDYMTKPVNQTTLLDMLNKWLKPSALPADSIEKPGKTAIKPSKDLAPPPATSGKPSKPETTSLKGASVLLVEDNDVNRMVARRLLEKTGVKVDEAADGSIALQQLESNRYDLVLMDCRMPIMDGYEATGEIRARQKRGELPAVPIIAMTANAMAGDRKQCIAAGMDDYLTKPVNRDTLSQMLLKWIKPMDNSGKASSTANKSTSGETMTTGSEIDMSIIDELKSIMEEDFISLLESYIKNITPLYKELHAAAVADNIAGMVNPAHSMKSSSANIGAMKVSATAKAIEMAARENDGVTAKKGFQTLNKILPPAVKELSAIIAANK